MLTRRLMNHKYAHWVVILQEYDLHFHYPKRKKALILAEFITDLTRHTKGSIVNDFLPDEHLFFVATDDPWYGDIPLFLRTQKFRPHLTRDERQHIHHQAPDISS